MTRRRFGPTEKEIIFIDRFTEHGDATLAAKEAGYSEHTAQVQGSQLKKKLKDEIDDTVKDKLDNDAALARSVIAKLAREGKSEDVRLKASKDIMDRAGYKPVEVTKDVTEKKPFNQMVIELIESLGEDIVKDKYPEVYAKYKESEAVKGSEVRQ